MVDVVISEDTTENLEYGFDLTSFTLNEGVTIDVVSGRAVSMPDGGDANIVILGNIVSGGSGLVFDNDGPFSTGANSSISASGLAVSLYFASTVNLTGDIEATGSTGIGAEVLYSGSVTNSGTISGVSRGVQLEAAGSLTNTGSITSEAGIGALALFTDVDNQGLIQGATTGLLIDSPDSSTFLHTGTIIGGVTGIDFVTFGNLLLINEGEIDGGTFALNFTGSANETVINRGTLTGDVMLGDRNDYFRNENGGTHDGIVFGGDGRDRYISSAANETFDGGAGTADFMRLSGNAADYVLTENADGSITVTDQRMGAPDGTDTVINVEFLRFTDGFVKLASVFVDDYVISADTTANIVFDSMQDTLLVETGATLTGSVSPGFGDHEVDIQGSLVSTGAAIDLSASQGGDRVEIGAGGSVSGSGTAIIMGDGGNIVINAGTVIGGVTFGSGDDRLDTKLGTIDGEVFLGAGNDRFAGSAGFDRAKGGQGADNLSGRGGDDVLFGGAGDDVIRGGEGNDRIHAGGGNDKVSGNDGDDDLRGGSGDDVINGGGGNDSLLGGSGDDFLWGRSGDDILDGGAGTNDQARYSGDLEDYEIVLLANGDLQVSDLSANDGVDNLTGVEFLIFNDVVVDTASYATDPEEGVFG